MYCKKCGKQIDEDAVFCSFCGTAQNQQIEQNSDDKQVTIAQRLKPYKELKESICLECGYRGLMGVVRKQKLPLKIRVTIIIIELIVWCAIYSQWGFNLLTFVICCVIFVFIDWITEKKVLFCPSCCKELNER